VTYSDSVQFLYALGNEIKTARLGLGRIRAVLDALGNPERAYRVVHVAGTNGKGSTCAMIEAALRSAGVRTGLFTSPHLVEPTERIQIDGHPVTPEQFCKAFETVQRAAESIDVDGPLTYFETVTAMGFWLFRESGVETAVVEVGLGGRLDATNVVAPALTVITPIDFDHEVFLGNTIEAIAGEKAGILKPGVPAVFARQRPEAAAVIEARAAELGIRVKRAEDFEIGDLDIDAPVANYLPELHLDPRITSRQLLDHTSGLRDYFTTRRYGGGSRLGFRPGSLRGALRRQKKATMFDRSGMTDAGVALAAAVGEQANRLAHEVVLPRHAPGHVGPLASRLERELDVVGAFHRPQKIELDANELARAAFDDGHAPFADRLTAARPAELRPSPAGRPFECVLGIRIHLGPGGPGFPVMEIVDLHEDRVRRRGHCRRPRNTKLTGPRRNEQSQNREHGHNAEQNVNSNHDSILRNKRFHSSLYPRNPRTLDIFSKQKL
jgi:hypothetical protein